MPEDSTRRLLKVFGVTVTEFEDASQAAVDEARELGSQGDLRGLLGVLQDLLKASQELNDKWLETTRLIFETQERACREVTQILAEARRRA